LHTTGEILLLQKEQTNARYCAGSGVTQNFQKRGDTEEFCGDPTVRQYPKVWSRNQKWNKYCSAKDSTLVWLRCGTIQKELLDSAVNDCRRCKKNSPQKKAMTMAAKSRQFTAHKAGKVHFL